MESWDHSTLSHSGNDTFKFTNSRNPHALNVHETRRYEDFTTIDWFHDVVPPVQSTDWPIFPKTTPHHSTRAFGTIIRDQLWNSYKAIQGWIVVSFVGIVVGFNAAFLSIVTEWLLDFKSGYCKSAFYLNRTFCCWGENENCRNWQPWSSFALTNYLYYITWATIFAAMSTLLVKNLAPYAAGSGISEIKCIIAGFIMKGFLGFKTLFIKSVSLPLAIASGLSVGKEGPSVHYAVCVGNVISRTFEKYRLDPAKTREIMVASAAAGVSVAFGSPIGGVLFSIEEIASHFPLRTIWRSFFCALVATWTLKMVNPFRTGEIVLFAVSYNRGWHFFELIFFIILGLFGGLYGAFLIKWNLRVQAFRKRYLANYSFWEVCFLTAFTALLCFPSQLLSIDMAKSLKILFSECTKEDFSPEICDLNHRWRNVISLAYLTFLRGLLVIISNGCNVPAGIFIPSMAVGALFGRLVGMIVQAVQDNSPEWKIFSACHPDIPCITPGAYAFLGAGAALSGVLQITVSVVVIMFELTGALTYILPTMIVVGVSKTVSESLGKGGLSDRFIWFSGFPFLDTKEDHIFGTTIEKVMTKSVTSLPANNLKLCELEEILQTTPFRSYPIVESYSVPKLIGFIRRADLLHAIDLFAENEGVSSQSKCIFIDPSLSESGDMIASSSTLSQVIFDHDSQPNMEDLNFAQHVNCTPLTLQPDLPLETIMDIFKKIGPRFILIERRGMLVGLVTVKDCLKYQFTVEAMENPRDDSYIRQQEEKLWLLIRRAVAWSKRKVIDFLPNLTLDLDDPEQDQELTLEMTNFVETTTR